MLTEFTDARVPSKAWEKEMGGYNYLPKKSEVITFDEFMRLYINEIFNYEEFRQPAKHPKNGMSQMLGDMKVFIKEIEHDGKKIRFGLALLRGHDKNVCYKFNDYGWEILAKKRGSEMY